MIPRTIENEILKARENMPVICVTGPRQSGKTTLVRHIFPDYQYYNLEFAEHRQFAASDPTGFLSAIDRGIIIDEVQRLPEILSSIQYFSDEKKLPGKIIITGSQNILLMQSVSQTLAGRVALFTLLPFSIFELEGTQFEEMDFEKYLVKSLYPRIYDNNLNSATWLQDYISTYIDRDVRQITAVKDLSLFSNFIKLCAGHTGQIVNYSTFSNNLGVDVKTIRSWMSVLEASYIVFIQQPYFMNINKRLIKSPRLFFYDTGLVCHLLGINSPLDFQSHYLKGGLFESFIISEINKYLFNHKIDGKNYFFRDSNGNEIDVILEFRGRKKAIEIKSGKTIVSDFFKGFDSWGKVINVSECDNYLVYGGDETQQRSTIKVLGWRYLLQIFNH